MVWAGAWLLCAGGALWLLSAQSVHAREVSGKVTDDPPSARQSASGSASGSAAGASGSGKEEIIEPAAKKEGVEEAAKPASGAARSSRSAKSSKGAASNASGATDLRDLRERLDQKLAEVRAAQERANAAPRPSAGPRKAVKPITRLEDDGDNAPQAVALARAHRGLDTPIALAGHGGWSYAGENGPQAWGSMKADFATCSSGQRQSPIDIRDGIRVDLEPIKFDYHPTAFRVIDNGHTIQVNVDPGNSISVMGRRFELVQFHFHRPSEERINGRQFAMVAHLVHKDPEGKLAVVAVLIDPGKSHPVVQQVWNNLPLEKNEEQRAGVPMDLAALLPETRTYYTYMGSLTTPPCSEGVLWMVLKQPVELSLDQIGIFSRLYPMNARPVQANGGRLIKESN